MSYFFVDGPASIVWRMKNTSWNSPMSCETWWLSKLAISFPNMIFTRQ